MARLRSGLSHPAICAGGSAGLDAGMTNFLRACNGAMSCCAITTVSPMCRARGHNGFTMLGLSVGDNLFLDDEHRQFREGGGRAPSCASLAGTLSREMARRVRPAGCRYRAKQVTVAKCYPRRSCDEVGLRSAICRDAAAPCRPPPLATAASWIQDRQAGDHDKGAGCGSADRGLNEMTNIWRRFSSNGGDMHIVEIARAAPGGGAAKRKRRTNGASFALTDGLHLFERKDHAGIEDAAPRSTLAGTVAAARQVADMRRSTSAVIGLFSPRTVRGTNLAPRPPACHRHGRQRLASTARRTWRGAAMAPLAAGISSAFNTQPPCSESDEGGRCRPAGQRGITDAEA